MTNTTSPQVVKAVSTMHTGSTNTHFPELDVYAACEGIEALVCAVEALFSNLTNDNANYPEATSIPILLTRIDDERREIQLAMEKIASAKSACRN